MNAGRLNAMTISGETVSTLGILVARIRLSVFVVGSLLTGVMVASSGNIGFVGLMIPHIVRRMVGADLLDLRGYRRAHAYGARGYTDRHRDRPDRRPVLYLAAAAQGVCYSSPSNPALIPSSDASSSTA